MGKRGPQPESTASKDLRGNPGRRPLTKNEVQPDKSAPKCPAWLGKIGKKIWKQVMAAMPAGFIVSIDGLLLAQYCDAWEDYHEACAAITAGGMTYMTDKGFIGQNPAVNIKFKARADIRKMSSHFGLSPSDRVGLEFCEEEEQGGDDPLQIYDGTGTDC